jgi:hypothetical protein
MRTSSLLAALTLLFGSCAPLSGARADDSAQLRSVEAAYTEVDFDATLRLAAAALERGRNSAPATLRLLVLRGIAAAALDEPELARSSFRSALAVDPKLKLDQELSPKLRGPYLEAKGELARLPGAEALAAELTAVEAGLRISLKDPLKLSRELALSFRLAGNALWHRRSLPSVPENRIEWPVQASDSLEYVLQVLDGRGNVLRQIGSKSSPARLVLRAAEPRAFSTPQTSTEDRARAPYTATAAALSVLGLGGIGAGAYFHVRREAEAREWNSGNCETAGSSRLEQCSDVDQRRERAERLALGLYTGGGALLLGGLITWLVAPESRNQGSVTVVSVRSGARRMSLSLRQSF